MSQTAAPGAARSERAVRARMDTRLRWTLYLLGGLLVVSLLRVVTGADDIMSSGTLRAALIASIPIAWPAWAGCGPSGPGWSTSDSRA